MSRIIPDYVLNSETQSILNLVKSTILFGQFLGFKRKKWIPTFPCEIMSSNYVIQLLQKIEHTKSLGINV